MPLTLPDGRVLALDRPLIMGILNLTPDSFSDGGRFVGHEAAVAHGLAMVDEGADILDIGGESTRPGSAPVGAPEQIARTAPVIAALRAALDARGEAGQRVALSIDTSVAGVAAAALDAGAALINDVYAGRDPRNPAPRAVFDLAAQRRAPLVLMHMRGTPATMQHNPTYADVVAEVEAFLRERAAAAQAAGVPAGQIVLDPGIGFGKTKAHNLALLANLHRLTGLGYPLLLGSSRKRFMGSICPGDAHGNPPAPEQLVGATCATTAVGVSAGVRIFRVHDVRANRQAADVTWAIMQVTGSRGLPRRRELRSGPPFCPSIP